MTIPYTFWKKVADQRDAECQDLDDENIRQRRRIRELERENDRLKEIVKTYEDAQVQRFFEGWPNAKA